MQVFEGGRGAEKGEGVLHGRMGAAAQGRCMVQWLRREAPGKACSVAKLRLEEGCNGVTVRGQGQNCGTKRLRSLAFLGGIGE
jgi:hypothetical protein